MLSAPADASLMVTVLFGRDPEPGRRPQATSSDLVRRAAGALAEAQREPQA